MFIRTQAGQYARRDIGQTYVAMLPGERAVIGYYTLAASAIEFVHLPATLGKKLPKHPVPTLLLGRLAVYGRSAKEAVVELHGRAEAGDGGTRIGKMNALYQDPHFTFRFNDHRSIPRFHLEGVSPGQRVKVFKIDPDTGERLGLLATATVGENGWVDLQKPIVVQAGEAFIAVE